MVKASHEKVKGLLRDTITLLCKNGLEFANNFTVEAVIGVTLDNKDVFLMSINELVKSDLACAVSSATGGQEKNAESGAESDSSTERYKRKRAKRKHKRMNDSSITLKTEPGTSAEHVSWGQEESSGLSLSVDAVDDSQTYPPGSDGNEPPLKKMHGQYGDTSRQSSYDDEENKEDDEEDIVFIKQELSEQDLPSCTQQTPYSATSQDTFSPASDSAMWPNTSQSTTPQRYQQQSYIGSGGTFTATQQQGDNSQIGQYEVSNTNKEVSGQKRKLWKAVDMENAQQAVAAGSMTITKAAQIFNVPRETLRRRVLKGQPSRTGIPHFTENEESLILAYIRNMENCGRPATVVMIKKYAGLLAAESGKPFANGNPSGGWWRKFKLRHPDLKAPIVEDLDTQ